MTEHQQHLDNLAEIRNLMNRSSRFLSLSGLSGVCAGVCALAGAGAAWFYMHDVFSRFPLFDTGYSFDRTIRDFYIFFAEDAGSVLIVSLLCGWYFSSRKAKKAGIPFWDHTAWRALMNLAIPLVAGGLFCFALLLHGVIGLIAPATLIFYGLALLNASKYTVNDIRYLGLSQVALGLLACVFIGYGIFFWAFGFGVLHIVYGAAMWWKYER